MSHQRVPLVLPLSEVATAELPLVGGKAHALGVLAKAGFAVPEGFVLTTEALRSAPNGVALTDAARAMNAWRSRAATDVEEEELAGFRNDIMTAPLPSEVQSALEDAMRRTFPNGEALAVRSSGTKEDLESASFAGQYETSLNVIGLLALELAVKRCWASLFHPRVVEYARRLGEDAHDLTMAVLVQRLVPSEVAGVLFTVNPITGREQEMLVEAVFGLGESLVSGRVNADRCVVCATSGQVQGYEVGSKSLKVESDAGGGTRETSVAAMDAQRQALRTDQLRQLVASGAAIQEHYGRPMDVEWAFAADKLWILQARPVTNLSFAPDLGEWTTADFRDGGVSSDVCAPFMWSLYELALSTSMPRYFQELKLLEASDQRTWGRMFFARPYWNLGAVKELLISIPGFNERNFDTDLGIVPTYEGSGRSTPFSLLGMLRALPTAWALQRSYRNVLERHVRYARAFRQRTAPFDLTEDAIAEFDATSFAAQYRALISDLYFDTETLYFTTIYNTSNSKLDFNVSFDIANRAWDGSLNYLNLVGGLRNVSHLRPLKDIHETVGRCHGEGRRIDDAIVRAFATRWKHHSRKELDIRVARWQDDLPFVRQLLEKSFENYELAQDPKTQEQVQYECYRAERERARRALRWRPLARRKFLNRLDTLRRYAWWREEMRDYSTRLYHLVRLWSTHASQRLIAAGQLVEADDVWYLSFQDVLAALEGSLERSETRRRVGEGRRLVRSFRAFRNPDEIGSQYRYTRATTSAEAGNVLRGTGCSPGRAEGRARVITVLEEQHQVCSDDILVTCFTDPGWTPVFARLSGIVTETGGVLAHAAVISREYGIPAVLAVPQATAQIADGDRIAIDGTQGTVEIIRRYHSSE